MVKTTKKMGKYVWGGGMQVTSLVVSLWNRPQTLQTSIGFRVTFSLIKLILHLSSWKECSAPSWDPLCKLPSSFSSRQSARNSGRAAGKQDGVRLCKNGSLNNALFMRLVQTPAQWSRAGLSWRCDALLLNISSDQSLYNVLNCLQTLHS